MNIWTILTIVIVALVIVGVAVASVNAIQGKQESQGKCTGCNGSCSQEKNCGQETCGAMQGKTCNCNR